MRIRKDVRDLDATERGNLISALQAVKADGTYGQLVVAHQQAMDHATPWGGEPANTGTRNAAHRGPAFLPWHREYLLRLEDALDAKVPGVTLPFWNWADDELLPDPASAPVWGNDLLGGDGDDADGDIVKQGPFRQGQWTIVDTAGSAAGPLRRDFGMNIGSLPSYAQVNALFDLDGYDRADWDSSAEPSFRNTLEGWLSDRFEPELHNRVHVWVGGSMLAGTSPNDPAFFLHHCFVDKLWADWQEVNDADTYLPNGGGPGGHNLTDSMFPWDAESDPPTPAAVLSTRARNFDYDRMGTLYRNLRLANERTLPVVVRAGAQVDVRYELVNTSPGRLVVPLNTDFSRPFRLLGTRQHWIERLGEDPRIPSIPSRIARDGRRYAAGGAIIPTNQPRNLLEPATALSLSTRVNTTGYPRGRYRLYIQYKRLGADASSRIDEKATDFWVI